MLIHILFLIYGILAGLDAPLRDPSRRKRMIGHMGMIILLAMLNGAVA